VEAKKKEGLMEAKEEQDQPGEDDGMPELAGPLRVGRAGQEEQG
jgi:hypothetical protein